MKCPSCGHFYDDKASDDDGPECPPCAEEMMASDVIGKGDTISREQAIGALEGELLAYPDNRVRYNTNRDAIAMLRSLPAIAPSPIEAERVPVAVRLAAEILCNHVEPGWENSKAIVREWIASERAR